ncbi:MAG: hypothetical protein V4812_21750 [Pseudomonadota bacterium]
MGDQQGRIDSGTLARTRSPAPGVFNAQVYATAGGAPSAELERNAACNAAIEGISKAQGQLVVEAAKTFVGATYFENGGSRSTEESMDCSGAIWLAYNKAGLPTSYYDSRSFPSNSKFIRSPNNTPQQGDVGQWNGHMLIYDEHAGSGKNGWSARRPGINFSAQSTQWWSHLGQVKWFRYRLSATCTGNSTT